MRNICLPNSSIKVTQLLLSIILIIGNTQQLHGQFSGYNLAEFQYGGFPQDEDNNFTYYDRIVASYSKNSFRLSGTVEQFTTPAEDSRYFQASQFLLHYRKLPFDFIIGNFYETLGRGLLLRAFEIPAATIEDLSFRSRHYFHRDILGFNFQYQSKAIKTKFLYGRPLNYLFPPTFSFDERRPDTFGALSFSYNTKNHLLGFTAMHHSFDGAEDWYAMVSASGSILNNVSYYTEAAKNISAFEINDFSTDAPYAIYGSLNLFHNSLGLSTEFKHYNNFLIGSGINEPPALVKEHSYKVLNRSIHVLEPTNESGYQVELFYTFPDLSILTINNTLAVNDLDQVYRFSEYFVEYAFSLFDNHETKLFIDYANDPLKLEEQRFSIGSYIDWKIAKYSSVNTNYEFQTFKRDNNTFQNHVMILGYSYKSKLFLFLEGELSNDSFLTDDDNKIWLGTSARYRLKNGKNTVQLFVGERRGGPACSAGICYEVLDFKGVELRITTRF